MNYIKPALTFEQQADLLIARGLQVNDKNELVEYLQRVNYYRLSGYWYIFKKVDPQTGDETLKPGTTFEKVVRYYEFDRKLRLLLMDAIERIEVAILRTRLVEMHTLKYGPFGYADIKTYNPKFNAKQFHQLLGSIADDESRSYEEFIKRYRQKYSSEPYLPLWMVTDLMSFGQLVTLYRNLDISIKQTISHQFNLFPPVLDSWLLTLNTVRNSCAHHARLWNRPIPLAVKIPHQKNDPRWYQPRAMPNNRLFTILTIVQYLMNTILPGHAWKNKVVALLAEYPQIPLRPMGIPTDWQVNDLWK
jgi:abortive infection bacteriophage resistance protein